MRRLLIAMGVAMTVLEVVNAPELEVPAAALVFAAGFAGLTLWFARRGSAAPAVLLGVLFLFELLGLAAYDRVTWVDWALQSATLVLSSLGLVAVVREVATRQRSGLVQRGS